MNGVMTSLLSLTETQRNWNARKDTSLSTKGQKDPKTFTTVIYCSGLFFA